MRPIDADALHAKIYEDSERSYGATANIAQVLLRIETAPTIEAKQVRHGRWVFQKGDNKETVDGWICTVCKYGFHTKVPYFEVFKYCPMCGARMDGGGEQE